MFALAHFAVAAPAGAFNRFPTPAPPANMSPGSTSYPTDVGGRYNGGPTSNDQYGAPAGGFTSQMPPGNGPAGSTSYPADVGGRYNGGPTSNKPYDPYQAELDPKDPPRDSVLKREQRKSDLLLLWLVSKVPLWHYMRLWQHINSVVKGEGTGKSKKSRRDKRGNKMLAWVAASFWEKAEDFGDNARNICACGLAVTMAVPLAIAGNCFARCGFEPGSPRNMLGRCVEKGAKACWGIYNREREYTARKQAKKLGQDQTGEQRENRPQGGQAGGSRVPHHAPDNGPARGPN
ncbi:hypothetical protein MCOR29_007869 [Pyricularia oryzae]|nr:hypothetical protein MCOR01_010306 [Pyricularia oryzae]KAI6283027.1 hypothetical protein MCOR26_002570 [Pyricularia oryzae]KAI6312985.1 hypothetical protein MCOR29_007869 [Pyricularia oryzae]KAI6364349.1 hypothetical protein MCOR31_007459 [Pyricularia oryzae]KAI6412666.1 hypothetical protein MCOR20_003449 [Pyricularia oryzae]